MWVTNGLCSVEVRLYVAEDCVIYNKFIFIADNNVLRKYVHSTDMCGCCRLII